MRLVGPNCLGVIDTDPDVRLDASFAPTEPPAGHLGLLSQSGGVGIALLEQAHALGIGLSAFVSVGNKADLSGNDFLEWCEQDERTRAVLLYLESFGNPRKFARIARRVGRTKPIVAVKAGRSAAGARPAASHTGALLAGSEAAVGALFRQAGVLRADTLGELFDLAALLEHQPLPTGNRVAIVTNAGGPGILAADACVAAGLELPTLPAEVQEAIAAHVPTGAALSNPVDLLAAASPEAFGAAVRPIGERGAVDAIVARASRDGRPPARGVRRAGDAPPGPELLVGATSDPLFGPVVACGAGGRAVELLHDVSVRLTPVTDRDAREMVDSLAIAPLLRGARGEPPVDLPALEQVVLRIGVLVDAHPEIAELGCNPVIAHPGGAVVVDARVRVVPVAPPTPAPALRG